MPIESHTSFVPLPPARRLWRYLDIAKFLSLICSGQMWFSNAEVLAQDDPQEAVLPPSAFKHRDWNVRADVPPDEWAAMLLNKSPLAHSDEEIFVWNYNLREFFIYNAILNRRSMFLSSWHAGERESAAMWKIYARNEYGLAITSNSKRAKAAFADVPETIYIGQINYIDHLIQFVDAGNVLNPVNFKRMEYNYESEARFVHWNHNIVNNSASDVLGKLQPLRKTLVNDGDRAEAMAKIRAISFPPGISFACDLKELIDEIWISPYAPPWVEESVVKLCGIIGFVGKIRRSSLLAQAMS
jgi:hypothetical protein